jgi:hypothetical protein
MLEKLFSLLLHAKGGALATVLVIGASGALVTATVQNGMTTVTITQPSTSTDGSTATTPSDSTTTTTTTSTNPVILALFNRTKAEDDPTAPATGGNGCSDAAKAANEQVKRVDSAFQTDHQAVTALNKDAKSDAAKKLVKVADKDIKDIRQAAVKAIHATFTCAKNDDEKDTDKAEEDKDTEDDDNSSTTGTTTGTTSTTTTTGPSVAFSGADAKAIADLAITAMDAKVAKLKTDLAALPAAAPKADTKKSDTKSNSDKTANKGKGNSKGHNDNKGDDD